MEDIEPSISILCSQAGWASEIPQALGCTGKSLATSGRWRAAGLRAVELTREFARRTRIVGVI